MPNEFDLDINFEEQDPDLSALTPLELKTAIAKLPSALGLVAQGVLVDKDTMSNISQNLGIRQSELVTRLHRAKIMISENRE
jgi:DNA-directed RNA polymerase specialized sigma24 family protein